MIPKTIHYCWFGGKPLPELAQKCIASWEKYCPEYEIVRWDESNFDIGCCAYVSEAYAEKKWAFVSDYARFWILYHEGGVYFDTDVELIRPIDDILEKGAFAGCEHGQERKIGVNPGLGMAAEAGNDFCRQMLELYAQRHFIKPDGNPDLSTIVQYTTALLEQYGWKNRDEYQIVEGIQIYPTEYFCPKNYTTSRMHITSNTRSVHHYTASWISRSPSEYFKRLRRRLLSRQFREKLLSLKNYWQNRRK